YLGLVARTMGRLDDAAAHFEAALAVATRMRAPVLVARTQYEYATALRARAAPGDAARARQLLAAAHEVAEAFGMEELRAQTEALLAGDAGPRRGPAEPRSTTAPNVFRRDGEYWLVTYGEQTVRLRGTRGLGYLARLLAHPGREVHASDLLGPLSPTENPPLTEREARLGASVSTRGPLPRTAGGSPILPRRSRRPSGSTTSVARRGHARRWRPSAWSLLPWRDGTARWPTPSGARLAVTKGPGAALKRIAAAHPELGAHLAATVRRGYLCAYVPDPRHPIVWEGID